MANSYFNFKQFSIKQDECAMKVGTDGILLGAWTNVTKAKNIIDIGTGTGLIAIMLAQRSSDCRIDAIEIDQPAYEQACENVKDSPWACRINVIHSSIQDFITDKKYDLIVSNPPFFIVENTLVAPEKQRANARHSVSLNMDDLVSSVKRLLAPEGVFSIVLPFPNEANLLIKKMEQSGFACIRKLRLKPTPAKAPKRILMEFSKSISAISEEVLVVEDKGRHGYSDKFIELTKDFYLKF